MRTKLFIVGMSALIGITALIFSIGLFIYSGITLDDPYAMAQSFALAGITSLGVTIILSRV